MNGKRGCRGVVGRHLFFYVLIIVIMVASIVMLAACDDSDTMSAGSDNTGTITDNNTSSGDVENGDDNNADDNTPNDGDTSNSDKDDNNSDNNGKDDDKSDDDNKQDEMKEMSIEVKDAFFIYDGLYHGISIEGIPEGAKIEYEGAHEYKNAGVYEIKAKITADGYKDKLVAARLEIAKRKLDENGISFEDMTCIWDGEEHSIAVSGEIPADITVTYTNNGQVDVGVYEVVASFDTHGNYEDIADMRAKLCINEKFYSVMFIDDGEEKTVIQVGHGKGITDMPIPTPKAGYTVRWEDKDLRAITENMTVLAEYTPITYAISYDACGGLNDVRNAASYTVEDAGTEIYAAHREGYRFVCWTDEEGSAVSAISAEWLRDIELSAEWEAEVYEIDYVLGGGDNDERNAMRYTVEDDGMVLYDAHRDGYVFEGWYSTADCSGDRIESICGLWMDNVILYAKWSIEEYEICYVLGGGENDARNATGYTVEDDEITLYDARREYYIFCGWYEDEAFDGERISMINGAYQRSLTLYAKWERVYEVRDGEIVGYDYSYGDTVVVPSELYGEKVVAIADGVLQSAKRIEIRAALATIGANTFAGCTLLEELNITGKVGNIADGALKDCVSLCSLTLPYMGLTESCESDGTYYPIAALFGEEERDGFYEVAMTPTLIFDGIVDYDLSMERNRYVPNALKELTVLGGVVFGFGMKGLTSVERVSVCCEEIRQFAFRECTGLAELTILGELVDVNNTILYGCEALTVVYVENESVYALVQAALQKGKLTDVRVDIMQ